MAASAASVIACGGDSDISPTAMLMVHNVSAESSGDYHQMDKTSNVLKKANQAMAAAYVEKTGMKESDALAMMENETWLTAADAVKKALSTGLPEIMGCGWLHLYLTCCLAGPSKKSEILYITRPYRVKEINCMQN